MDAAGATPDAMTDEIRARVAQLTTREFEVLALLSVGLSNEKIGKRLYISVNTVKQHLTKAREKLELVGRTKLYAAPYYVRYVLPFDLTGKPLDPTKVRYTTPGEKLADWVGMARRERAKLRTAGVLTPRRVEAAMLLTNLENAALGKTGLGKLMSGEPVALNTMQSHYRKLLLHLSDSSMVLLAVVATLAPLTESD